MVRMVVAAFAAVVCLVAFNARAEEPAVEMVPNPQYVSWKDHKVGTAVNFAMEISMGEFNMKQNATQVLKSVNADEVVVEVAMNMGGMEQKQETRIPAKVKKGTENLPEGMDGKITTVGEETIEVDGKSYKCEAQDFEGAQQGNTVKGRIWRCPSLPGGVAKMTMDGTAATGQTMKMTMTVTGIESK